MTDTQCGWFASIVTLMMTVFVFPVSLLVDRWNRKKAIGVILGGVIAETLGWRYAFSILAIPGLIVAILFFWVKDYKTVQMLKTTHDGAQAFQVKMKFADIVREFLHTRSKGGIETTQHSCGNPVIVSALKYRLRIDSFPEAWI